MAGMAHLGVALGAKRVAPKTPLWILVTSSYAIDLLFMVFMLAGKERMPSRAGHEAPVEPAMASTNPWSHGSGDGPRLDVASGISQRGARVDVAAPGFSSVRSCSSTGWSTSSANR